MTIEDLKQMQEQGYPIVLDGYRRIRYLEKLGERFPHRKEKYDIEIQEIKEMIKENE